MKNLFRQFALALSISLLLSQPSRAEVGNDNPMGPTGEYNGSITTGGSYDPYTGNAKRFVDDLTVTGSVGAYPLKWTRVLNTRNPSPWSHSYNWGLWVRPYQPYHYYDPPYEGPGAVVNYPDGRTLNFAIADQPYIYSQDPNIGEPQDRLVHMGSGNFDLLMRDGGRVKFQHPAGSNSGGDLVATQIIDPYGLTTFLTRDGAGRLQQITEPGGRYLQLNYTTSSYVFNGQTIYYDVLSSVQAFSAPGQLTETVIYTYTTTHYLYYTNNSLTQVDYDDGTHAYYTYGPSNVGEIYAGLIQTCDDVRFAGPMKKIEYEYMAPGGPYEVSFGQIKREKNATTHQIVSEVTYPTYNPGPLTDADFQRTETRGDGATRSFQYTSDGHAELKSNTDFKGQTTHIDFPYVGYGSTYRKSVTDARGNTSSIDMEWNANAVMTITHPGGSTVQFTYTDAANPYYLASRTDELGHTTSYGRDSYYHRITRTDYPDTSFETFDYNPLGQVVSHTLTSGGVETFGYDEELPAGRGLKTSHTDPYGNVTHYHYYSGGACADRLQNVVDPNGNATWYEYNGRGEVTKVTHQDGSYVQSSYNPDGTMATSTDELGHTTNYTYDEYKRALTVTNPMNETTTNSYALDWANPLVHTTNSVKFTTSPMNKNVVFDYDANFRKIDQVAALGTADAAWTFFEYDVVGNLIKTTDARWKETHFGFDNRNRQVSVTNALNETTTVEYNAVNKTKETRPDGTFRSWDYDTMNRLWHAYEWRTNEPATAQQTTTYDHNLTNTIRWIIDAKGARYDFYYDALNRKASEFYPVDATGVSRYNAWYRDAAGNIYRHDSTDGNVQIFEYDNRNRMTNSYWWSNVGPHIATTYDAAGRVTSVATNGGETAVAYGYDNANRQIWEDQTVAGYSTHRVQHDRDADGNASNTHIPGWYLIWHAYTQRNQLAQIQDGGGTPWFNFSYDAAGNMTKRQAVYGGVNDSMNCPTAQYDPLNRPTMWENTGAADTPFARSWYQYDNLNREVATWRDEQSGKGERFGYNALGQLTGANYNADQVWTGNPLNATLNQSYDVTPLNRNVVWNNGQPASYSANALNQYTNVGGQTLSYDGNFNLAGGLDGLSANYDAASHLVSASRNGNNVQFTYDGLGRCLKRTVNGVATIFGYDGWKPLADWAGDGSWWAFRMYGAGPDEVLWLYDSRVGYMRVHSDVHGNISWLLGWGGNGIEKYTYDAFGKPTITDWSGNVLSQSASYNRFMFQGREWIPELGIYDYRHRMYHPQIGRFLQMDPSGFDAGDMNLFRYCADDPVDRSDPTGLADTTLQDRTWNSACFFDTGNSFQGSWGEFNNRSQAGMNGGRGGGDAGGAKSISSENEGGKGIVKTGVRAYKSLLKWANKIESAARMTSEFVTGKGSAERVFDSNSAESEDLRSDSRYAPALRKASTSADQTAHVDFGARGLMNAGLHPTRQFVGSYDVRVNENGAAYIYNETSVWSGLLHGRLLPAISHERPGAGGTTRQIYVTESPSSE